jgi:hypothetical protein
MKPRNSTMVLPGMFEVQVREVPKPLPMPAVALHNRAEALERVEAHAPDGFSEDALQAVRKAAVALPRFVTDQVWAYLDGKPYEARAMGPVMLKAARLGYIRATGEFQVSSQPQCNGRPMRVWESLLKVPK